MSQRPLGTTVWIWCILVISTGPIWTPVSTVAVGTSENIPSTIEEQAKFFQDFFSVQLSPYKIEFGHVCEDPNTWEQRYEKKDFKNHRDMGKVRWGDKQGGYGEHYWDLNHAGHTGNKGSDDYDDGSYHEDPHENYKEAQIQPIKYEHEEYTPAFASHYEDNERAKRAHPDRGEKKYKKTQTPEQGKSTEHNNDEKSNTYKDSVVNNDRIDLKKILLKASKKTGISGQYDKDVLMRQNEKQIVSDNNQKIGEIKASGHKHFVPNQDRIGTRQRLGNGVASASASRLFLDISTGHIIDTSTGQAYVLHPVPPSN